MAAAISTAATAQDFASSGVEYRIGGALPGDQVYPAVCLCPSGGYLVWQDSKLDKLGQGIAAVRLDGAGQSLGNPFLVTQKTRGHQQHPQVASLVGDGAVFVWQSGQRSSNNVFARFLRSDGSFLAGEVQVNPPVRLVATNYMMEYYGMRNNRMVNRKMRVTDSYKTIRTQNVNPVVAALPDGGAVVAYFGSRRLYTNFNQIAQKVTRSRGRSYTNDVPTRASASQDWMQDVFVQRFGADGRKVGGETLVNQWTKYNQRDPSIAALANGGFVVTWVSERSLPPLLNTTNHSASSGNVLQIDIIARMFDSAGAPLGNEFTVNSDQRPCSNPSIAALPEGGFTVVWEQRAGASKMRKIVYGPNGEPTVVLLQGNAEGLDIYARSYDAAATATQPATRLNTYTYGDQFAPKIASLGPLQMVVWSSLGQDGSWEGVFGQMLSGGVPSGGEFQVNTTTLSKQIHPTVAADGQDRFVVSWSGFEATSSFDVFAQSYVATSSIGGGLVEQANLQRQAVEGGVSALGSATAPFLPSGAIRSTGGSSPLRVTISRSADRTLLNWNSQSGARYQVQKSADLKAWSNVGSPGLAPAASDGVGLDLSGEAGFYRVLRLP